jgi:hypothetical protein
MLGQIMLREYPQRARHRFRQQSGVSAGLAAKTPPLP